MIYKTHGIIISNIPFGEKSVITKVYTEMFGLLSFIVNGVRGGKGSIKPSHLEILNRAEIVIYKKGNEGLHRIKEFHLKNSDSNIVNQASNIVSMFLSEVLQKSLHEHQPDEKLFLFLDEIAGKKFEINPAVLSLYFLIHYSNCLGILHTENDFEENKIFDLDNGIFTHNTFVKNKISFPESKIINDFLQLKIDEIKTVTISERNWNTCISGMIDFFTIHIFHGKNLRTFSLLKEII